MRNSRPRLLAAVAVLALALTGLTAGLEITGRHSHAGHSQRPGNNAGGQLQPSTSIAGRVPSSPRSRRPRVSQSATATPGTGRRTSSSASPSPSVGVPSQSQLEAALLTAPEVGPTFTEQPEGSGISDNSLNTACPALADGANPSETAIRAFVADPDSTSITYVTEELLQYTASGAKAQLDQFAQVANACPSISAVIPTSPFGKLTVEIGVADEAFPAVGDQTAAVRVTGDVVTLGVTVSGDIVAVRQGGTVILVVNVAVQVNSGLTGSVVNNAYQKVAASW
jgi:hypothetical protein